MRAALGSESHLANVIVIIEAHADAVGGVAAQFCAAGAIQNLNLNSGSSEPRTIQLALQQSLAAKTTARGLLPLDLTTNVLHSPALRPDDARVNDGAGNKHTPCASSSGRSLRSREALVSKFEVGPGARELSTPGVSSEQLESGSWSADRSMDFREQRTADRPKPSSDSTYSRAPDRKHSTSAPPVASAP